MRRLLLPIAVLLAARVPALAQDAWIRLGTPHFELYTNDSEKNGRDAMQHFEQVRDFFEKASPVRKPADFPVRIILFKSPAQFAEYRPGDIAEAYYAGTQSRDYIVMAGIEKSGYQVALHEYTHLMFRHSGLKIPLWLNEGLADLFSSLRPSGRAVAVGDLLPGRIETLSRDQWLDFDALTTADQNSSNYNERNRAGVFYAESWLLTHMLFLSRDYAPGFPKFINTLNGPHTTAESALTAFGKTPAQVFQDLRIYFNRPKLSGLVFEVKLDKTSEEPEIQPVKPFDASLMLADLFAASGKLDLARREYERLAKAEPNDAEVIQSLGYLAWQKREFEAARGYFERAMAAGAHDARMFFYLAALENEAKQPLGKVTSALARAIELKPDYTDARLELGMLQINAKEYPAAIATLAPIHNIDPERAPRLFNALAYCYLQTRDYGRARKNAESARKWAKSEKDSAQAAQFLQFLDAQPDPARKP